MGTANSDRLWKQASQEEKEIVEDIRARTGNWVKAWTRLEYVDEQSVTTPEGSKQHKTQKSLHVVDCAETTMALSYAAFMRPSFGTVVRSISFEENRWTFRGQAPDSVGADIVKYARQE